MVGFEGLFNVLSSTTNLNKLTTTLFDKIRQRRQKRRS